ncbi:MAG TPA: NUDIX hydrolase [Beijerinckiaceae bacterium]|jgi:8-oxo-dGTP pyrophosphatase MutT (NUDIX family)
MKKNEPDTCIQYGALPFARDDGGAVRIMLVTSRETKRWIIPKGWPLKNRPPHGTAAREAYEEAGLVGRIGERSIGTYRYEKRLKHQRSVTCAVDVFPLEVERQLKKWPEKAERDCRWFSPTEAAAAVDEEELSRIIASLGEQAVPVPA